MIDPKEQRIQEILSEKFPQFSRELQADIAANADFKRVPEGATLMEIGQFIKVIPLLFDGKIKVLREDEEGNELLELVKNITGGFTTVLDGLKAFLEFGIQLNLVEDKFLRLKQE